MLPPHGQLFSAASSPDADAAVSLLCPRRASAWRAAIGDRMRDTILEATTLPNDLANMCTQWLEVRRAPGGGEGGEGAPSSPLSPRDGRCMAMERVAWQRTQTRWLADGQTAGTIKWTLTVMG